MRKRTSARLLASCLAPVIVVLGCSRAEEREPDLIDWPPLKSASQVAGTTIVPTLDTPIVNSGNAIWCATFQVAWNRACEEVVEGPLLLAHAEEITKRLNNSPVTEAVLPTDSYYVAAGDPKEGIVEEIHVEMAQRFPDVEPPLFENAQGLVAYAYLSAAAKFTTPFEQRTRPIAFTDTAGKETSVEGFCLYHGHDEAITHKQLSQANVLFRQRDKAADSRYISAFAIDLTADQDDIQVVVAVLPHSDSFHAMIEDIKKRTKAYEDSSRIREADTLAIPNVLFNLKEEFDQLIGPDKLILDSKKLKGYFISEAWQMIRFSLDKSGAIVESEAALADEAAEDQFYSYVADRPFLVLMKRRSASLPFFAAWIGNAELLEKREK